eukprot:6980290-Alexandrium_andersonii.AAC.1
MPGEVWLRRLPRPRAWSPWMSRASRAPLWRLMWSDFRCRRPPLGACRRTGRFWPTSVLG